MSQVLRNWTKSGLICQKKNCFKSVSLNIFKSHIQLQCMRFHIQPQLQISSDNIHKPCKSWFPEHRRYLIILKSSVKEAKKGESYVSDEAFKMLCSIFTMDKIKCQKIVHQKQFESCSTSHIIDTAHFLKELGVNTEHLIRAPWLLWQEKEVMSKKLTLIKHPFLFKNELDGLGFTIFQTSLINRYREKFASEQHEYDNYQNMIYYIAHKLNLPIDLLTLKLIRAWQALHVKKEKIDAVIQVLLDFKIEPTDIVNDVYVFFHNVDIMKSRLRKMKDLTPNLPLKLWVGRCTEFYFQIAYEKQKRKLSTRTLSEVLREELGLNDDDILLFKKKDVIRKLKTQNVEYKIQYLRENDLDISHLKTYPSILMYSEKRTIDRMKILKEKNILVTSKKLALSEKDFKHLVNNH